MSEFNRVSISESADDAYKISNAERQLGQQPQDQWSEAGMQVKVGHVRDAARVNLSAEDVYVNIPDSQIEPFPDLESQLQARSHPNYETSAAYREVFLRRVAKSIR
jgi:hypothetical protein